MVVTGLARRCRFRWERADRWWPLTLGSVAVLVGGPLFAVLGTPGADLMWPLHRFGVVGPTCGLTRGVIAIFRGQAARAWAFNPASFLAVAVALGGITRAGLAIAGKGWPTAGVRISRGGAAAGVGLLGLLWAYQQAHASFLLRHLR